MTGEQASLHTQPLSRHRHTLPWTLATGVDFTLPLPHFPQKSSIQRQHNFLKASYDKRTYKGKISNTQGRTTKSIHTLQFSLIYSLHTCALFGFLFWSILNEIQGIQFFHPSVTPYVALLEKQFVSKMSFLNTLSPSGSNKVLTLYLTVSKTLLI